MITFPLHLVLDQGLPIDTAEQLRASGFVCTHVGEIGMSAATDIEILEWALRRQGVIITLDADFHMMLALSGRAQPSVIRRLQGLNGPALAKLVSRTVEFYSRELAAGCMITVKARKTTCHILA